MENLLIIFGGGLAEPAKYFLNRTAENLSNIRTFDNVFVGRYSFESLYTPEFICKYDRKLASIAKDKRGSFYGTCREINLCDPVRFRRAIFCLKYYGIKTIVVEGGDGSSRQVAETVEAFNSHGINVIFPVPMTIDGINGGESAGVKEAVRLSVRDTEDMAATSLNTRDNEAFSVVVIKLQGRNRDDIIAEVLKYFDIKGSIADFPLNDVLLKVIPANYPCDIERLVKDVNSSYKRTLILLSEGSSVSIEDLKSKIKRKVRAFEVGHRSQSNNLMTEEDQKYYDKWIDSACKIVEEDPFGNYCLAYNRGVLEKKPIDYYALLNPKKNQKADLSKELETLLKEYM